VNPAMNRTAVDFPDFFENLSQLLEGLGQLDDGGFSGSGIQNLSPLAGVIPNGV
jgi:hypothetical protein